DSSNRREDTNRDNANNVVNRPLAVNNTGGDSGHNADEMFGTMSGGKYLGANLRPDPFMLMFGSKSGVEYLSVNIQRLITSCCFQYLLTMFESIVTEYLNDTKYSHWSIVSILEYTKSKCQLYTNSISDLKKDIYTALQKYKENPQNHKYLSNKLDKILLGFDKSFSTAEVEEFIDKLREEQEVRGFDTAFQTNVASACTVKALQSYRMNQVLIDELKDEHKKGGPSSVMVLRKRKNRVNYAESLSEVETNSDHEEKSKEVNDTNNLTDSSDTTLENMNEENLEQFGAHTIIVPTIDTSNKVQSCWPSHEISFQKITEERKLHLSSGRKVEDVLYAYALKLEYEQPAHSFIIDTSDDNIKNLFTKKEWEKIMNNNKKTVPGIDENMAKHLLKYKKKTPSEMRAHVMKPWLETIYRQEQHFDYQYIHQVFTYLLDEYESPKNRLAQPHAEGWYAVNIWSILIDKAFLNIPNIELVRGETCSITSSNRKNDGEMYRIKGQRKALGHRIDGIFQNTVNDYEYGGIEVAKTCQGPHDRKHLGDSLKLTKFLKDIFYQQSSIVDHNEAIIKKVEIVGLLHSRLQLQLLMDYGG
ncbi:3026_t:CDS:2, partial [Acaulospora colombiana]